MVVGSVGSNATRVTFRPGRFRVISVKVKPAATRALVDTNTCPKTAAASTKDYFFFYLATAAMFLLLTVMSNVGIHFVERRLMRGVRRA